MDFSGFGIGWALYFSFLGLLLDVLVGQCVDIACWAIEKRGV